MIIICVIIKFLNIEFRRNASNRINLQENVIPLLQ
jgi:hypothetical protein